MNAIKIEHCLTAFLFQAPCLIEIVFILCLDAVLYYSLVNDVSLVLFDEAERLICNLSSQDVSSI